jgi:hypothetical protein
MANGIKTNYLNPTNDDFNIDFLRNQPNNFKNILREENCYNPLIAISARNKLLFESAIPGLNSTWYNALRLIREGLQNKKLGDVVRGFEKLFKAGISIHNLIDFKGIFNDCQWVYNSKKTGFQDVVYNGDLPSTWNLFIENGPQFRTYIEDCFRSLGTPKDDAVGTTLPVFKWAVGQLIDGRTCEIDDQVFACLYKGLADAGRLFNPICDAKTDYENRYEIFDPLGKLLARLGLKNRQALSYRVKKLSKKEQTQLRKRKVDATGRLKYKVNAELLDRIKAMTS